MTGRWVVFEGLDGAGTTTQADLLSERLKGPVGNDRRVFSTAEPTRGPIGQTCREILKGDIEITGEALALLFTADRHDHLHGDEGVLARLDRGDWVVMDRYLYSTLAYQDGCDRDWLIGLNANFPRPDLVVFLETPVEECLRRVGAREGEAEIFEKSDVLARIDESYRWVRETEQDRSRWLILDGTRPADEISERVFETIRGWIS